MIGFLRRSGGRLKAELPHGDAICRVALSADGKRGASMGMDGGLKVWDLRTAASVLDVPGIGEAARKQPSAGLSLCDAGSHVAAAVEGGVIVREVETAAILAEFEGAGPVTLAGNDLRLFYRLGSAIVERVLADVEQPSDVCQIPPESRLLAIAQNGTLVSIGAKPQVSHRDKVIELVDHNRQQDSVMCNAISRDGRYAVTGESYYTGAIRIWDLETGALLRRYASNSFVNWDTDEIQAVAINSSGRRVFANVVVPQVSEGSIAELRVYGFRKKVDRLANNRGMRLRGGDVGVNAIAISDDGRTGLTGGADGIVRTWRIARWV